MISNMASFNAIVTLALLSISTTACQNTCILRDLEQLNVSCYVSGPHATNITWSLLDTETNTTLIFNFCEATICHPLIPRLADSIFVVTVTSDESGQYIQSSTLTADVKYGNLTKLSTLKQLQCHHNDKVITVCDSFDAYANPTTINDASTYLNFDAQGLAVVLMIDSIFPFPKCTLYVDHEPVSPNASIINYQKSTHMSDIHMIYGPESAFPGDFISNRKGYCFYGLNVSDLSREVHHFQVNASAETSDPARNVLVTDVMSIDFGWSHEVFTVCDFPEHFERRVVLTCRSEVVQDANGCEFEILTNGSSLRSVFNTTAKIKHADLPGFPMTVTECRTTLFDYDLGPGYHQFRARVLSYTNESVTRFSHEYTTPVMLSDVYFPGCVYEEVTDNAINVSCLMNLSKTAIGCEYEIRTNDTLTNLKGNITLVQDIANSTQESLPTLECKLTMNPRDLGFGYHQFRLTVVANDTDGSIIRIPFNITSPIFFYLPEIMVDTDSDRHLFDGSETSTAYCFLKYGGNPPGYARWILEMSNGTISEGNYTLVYTNKTLADYKDILCQPVSALKDNMPKTYVDLVAKQKGQILKFTANGYEHQFVAEIGKYVTLECSTSGTPKPVIAFRHVGRNRTVATRSSYYTFNVTSCGDAGRYVCTARQWSSSETFESNIEVLLKCPLTLRSEVNYSRVFSVKTKENVEIQIPVTGYPELNHYTLLRYSGNVNVEITTGYKASYLPGDNPDGTIIISFTNVQDDAFTNYTLIFGNGFGTEEEISFQLCKVTVDAPSQSNSLAKPLAIFGITCGGVAVLVMFTCVMCYVRKSLKKERINSQKKEKNIMKSDTELSKL